MPPSGGQNKFVHILRFDLCAYANARNILYMNTNTLPTGSLVVHAKTGETGTIIGHGYSPAGIPNYTVMTNTAKTWWYRSDAR